MANSNSDSYENPYYLSDGDNSDLTLVSDPLTGASDFGSWHKSMMTALNGRNKFCFVDGSLPEPADNAATWCRVIDVVRSWLMNSVSETMGQSVLYMRTAHEIWQKLLKRFKQNNVASLYQTEQQLHSLLQGSLDVNTFYTKVVTIWEDVKSAQDFTVCQCGGCDCELDTKWMDLFERNFVIKFLFGLNDSYENLRQQILVLDPLPDLDRTLKMVIQHEHQKMIKQTTKADVVVLEVSSHNDQHSCDSDFQHNGVLERHSEQNEVIGEAARGDNAKAQGQRGLGKNTVGNVVVTTTPAVQNRF